MSLNRWTGMGRIATDLELRKTQSGVSVCTFRIACERDFKNQNGEKEADFITIVAWRNTADFVSKYMGKGRMVAVEGKLQSRKWVDKNNQTRVEWEIQAENVYFADSKQSNGGSQSNGVAAQETADTGALFDDIEEFNGRTLPF